MRDDALPQDTEARETAGFDVDTAGSVDPADSASADVMPGPEGLAGTEPGDTGDPRDHLDVAEWVSEFRRLYVEPKPAPTMQEGNTTARHRRSSIVRFGRRSSGRSAPEPAEPEVATPPVVTGLAALAQKADVPAPSAPPPPDASPVVEVDADEPVQGTEPVEASETFETAEPVGASQTFEASESSDAATDSWTTGGTAAGFDDTWSSSVEVAENPAASALASDVVDGHDAAGDDDDGDAGVTQVAEETAAAAPTPWWLEVQHRVASEELTFEEDTEQDVADTVGMLEDEATGDDGYSGTDVTSLEDEASSWADPDDTGVESDTERVEDEDRGAGSAAFDPDHRADPDGATSLHDVIEEQLGTSRETSWGDAYSAVDWAAWQAELSVADRAAGVDAPDDETRADLASDVHDESVAPEVSGGAEPPIENESDAETRDEQPVATEVSDWTAPADPDDPAVATADEESLAAEVFGWVEDEPVVAPAQDELASDASGWPESVVEDEPAADTSEELVTVDQQPVASEVAGWAEPVVEDEAAVESVDDEPLATHEFNAAESLVEDEPATEMVDVEPLATEEFDAAESVVEDEPPVEMVDDEPFVTEEFDEPLANQESDAAEPVVEDEPAVADEAGLEASHDVSPAAEPLSEDHGGVAAASYDEQPWVVIDDNEARSAYGWFVPPPDLVLDPVPEPETESAGDDAAAEVASPTDADTAELVDATAVAATPHPSTTLDDTAADVAAPDASDVAAPDASDVATPDASDASDDEEEFDRYVPPPVHLSWRTSDNLDFEVPDVEDPEVDILIEPPTQMVQATSRRADANERRAKARARAEEAARAEAQARAQAEPEDTAEVQSGPRRGRRVLLLLVTVLVMAAATWFLLQRNGTQSAGADTPHSPAQVSLALAGAEIGHAASVDR